MIDAASAPRLTIAKQAVRARLILNDGTALEGAMYLASGERLQDLLNDTKLFVPFRAADQTFLLINKASISMCQPIDV